MWWSIKFSWQNFLLGALCGAIVMAGVWWRSTQVEQPYRISYEQAQDPETYDECLAAGNPTITCDAMMRVIARARSEEQRPCHAIASALNSLVAIEGVPVDIHPSP
jgi:hypothetical protein